MRECSPPTTCQMSHVTCHMSRVPCLVSHVMRHMSHFFSFFSFRQSGEAYQWRVCYQWGLPCLVFLWWRKQIWHQEIWIKGFLWTKIFFFVMRKKLVNINFFWLNKKIYEKFRWLKCLVITKLVMQTFQ